MSLGLIIVFYTTFVLRILTDVLAVWGLNGGLIFVGFTGFLFTTLVGELLFELIASVSPIIEYTCPKLPWKSFLVSAEISV